MALTLALLRKQIDRLVSLPAAQSNMFEKPEDERKTVRAELGKALEKWCKTDERAAAVVDKIVESRDEKGKTFRPSPADIRAAAQSFPTEESVPMGCRECGGSGMRIVTRRVLDRIAQKEIEVDGAADCDCELGRWRARKAAERMATA